MPNPGDVVIYNFPGAVKTKPRPSIIVSTALYHSVRPDVILGLLTTDLASATGPTDYILQDWAAAGLYQPWAFRVYLVTTLASRIASPIGQLSPRDWREVQARLRHGLAVT